MILKHWRRRIPIGLLKSLIQLDIPGCRRLFDRLLILNAFMSIPILPSSMQVGGVV
jgi:hypothetical protein